MLLLLLDELLLELLELLELLLVVVVVVVVVEAVDVLAVPDELLVVPLFP